MTPSASRVANRFELAHWNLDGLTRGEPVTLYHGTTRQFQSFSLEQSRTELVNKFYGSGIFLTPSRKIAWDYAYANRNIGFDPEVITDLKRVNANAGKFLEALCKGGRDVWEDYTPATLGVPPEQFAGALERHFGGLDANGISDLAAYVIGSKVEPLGGNEPVHIFNQSTGMPSWTYDLLDQLRIDSKKYRPKVYTVSVTVSNPLVTASKSAARSAKSKGYDCVVFYGADLVGGHVPEVAVYNPHDVHVTHVEV